MSETARLLLPLIDASQAQKHVTANEAFQRLDAFTQLVLVSTSETVPPVSAEDGTCYAVPAAATNAWFGQDGKIAIYLNGGWDFVAPLAGWRAWVADSGEEQVFDGADWTSGLRAVSPNGSAFLHGVAEVDHVLGAGSTSDTGLIIPANSVVYGVAGRVTAAITGALATWQLGVAGSPDRYGSGLGIGAGSYALGLTTSPLTYYADTALQLTATGGDFAAGTVRLAVHYAQITLPNG